MVASELFTAEDRAAIARAVSEAEKGTAGEIVPVVASTSDRYERAEDTFGLWLAITAISIVWTAVQGIRPSQEDWEEGWEMALTLLPILGILVAAWVAGVWLASRFPALKRLAASKGVMRARVEQRAAHGFHLFHVGRTKGDTGIVLYVSLFERMVCVRADPAVSQKVDPSEWKAICEAMMAALRDGRHREAFVEAIAKCGALLARHFPVQPGDRNELRNELRILE